MKFRKGCLGVKIEVELEWQKICGKKKRQIE
jgi:hypothetical protein